MIMQGGLPFEKNRGCHRAVPSPASLTCMIIILASFLSLSAQPRFFFLSEKDQIFIISAEHFQQGGSKGFGLRRQNLSHDTTCLGIMVIFLPLCTEGAPSLSLCLPASAIRYEVAIVLCQRNERAGTSLGAGSSTLSPRNVLIILHRRMKAEMVARASRGGLLRRGT